MFASFTTTVPLTTTSYRPDFELAVARTAPVGSRYYWHVRTCTDEMCSAYSPTRLLNLGRSDHDFNGDGLADIVVGAPGYGGEAIGHAYVYLGVAGAPIDAAPAVALTAPALKDYFATSLAFAGDVNGDGFADVVVGAYEADSAGAAYLYLGGPQQPAAAVADMTFHGAAPGDNYGSSVASTGDLNGDGFADFAVAAPNAHGDKGAVHVYFGGASGIARALTLDNDVNTDRYFGHSMAAAGDVDGDGLGELAVVVNSSSRACGYIYYGAGDGTLGERTAIIGSGVGPIVGAGDVNGDGFADVAVRFSVSDNGQTVSLYLGAPKLRIGGSPDASFSQPDPGFGASLASAGDVNGDGFGDIVIGVSERYRGSAGGAYLYLGGPGDSFDTQADSAVLGPFGGVSDWLVTAPGDINGDGLADVVVGSLSRPIASPDTFVHVYLGAVSHMFDVPAYTLTTPADDLTGGFGRSVAR